MTDGSEEVITPQVHELFNDMAKDIRSNFAKYREAGKWLDEYCSEDAYWQRQEDELKKLHSQNKRFPTLPIVQNLKQLEQEMETKRTPALLIRFQEARDSLLGKYEDQQFVPHEDARRIIMITWLLTDPDTEKANLNITQLEKWSWGPIDDVTKMSRGYAAYLWSHGGRVYSPWMKLVRIAWHKVARGQQHETSPAEPNTIVGETWTIAGIPIHVRALKSKLCCFKGCRKVAAYVGILLIIILLAAFYTRSLWLPLVRTTGKKTTADVESTPEDKKLLRSLKEICQDIDSRPLVQQEDTVGHYVGMVIEEEPLQLFEIIKDAESSKANLLLLFPGESFQIGPIGWKISVDVDSNRYPFLKTAKRGVQLRVSGRIEHASIGVIELSDASVEIDRHQ